MKKFIERRFKSERGFTLVELLAVLVILGLVVAIAIPAVGNIIEKAEGDANEAQEQMIIEAARVYEVQADDVSFPVTVLDLIDKGYLDQRQGELEGFLDGQVRYDEDVAATGSESRLVFDKDKTSEDDGK